MAENRSFRLHQKLLSDIIFRQAGTLTKAVLEGVMNAIDAGATECKITATPKQVTIYDNGRGMQTRAEIENNFEMFGTPHEDSERKVFGQFRMGRGQIFKYGVNTWRTGPWRMFVDAKQGLSYRLEKMKAQATGCKVVVDLYNELLPSEMGDLERGVIRGTRYAQIPIRFNGRKTNVKVEKENWDHVIDEAYVRLSSAGMLTIYNLGIYVMDIYAGNFGTGGEVVSRKQLEVNFARNDVQDSCPVWQKIRPFIRNKAAEEIKRVKRLNTHQRQRIANQIRDRQLTYPDFYKLPLFTLVTGRNVSLQQLYSRRHNHQITACKAGNVLGDTLMQHRVAMVLSDETLERFNVSSVEELSKLLKQACLHGQLSSFKPVPFDQLVKGMDRNYEVFTEAQLTDNEKLWLELIQRSKYELTLATEWENLSQYQQRPYWNQMAANRRIVIGQGPCSGWTDGSSMVAICRSFLKPLTFDMPGFGKLGRLLLHELCHGDSSACTHNHGEEFYELFHDSAQYLGCFIEKCVEALPSVVAQHQRKVTRKMLKEQDKLVRLAKAQPTAALVS